MERYYFYDVGNILETSQKWKNHSIEISLWQALTKTHIFFEKAL